MSAPAQADYPWHPSTDRLVKSALTHVLPQQLIGVLMTGMGNDGAEAMASLSRLGGTTIAESEETAVVWGMPGELVRAGGADWIEPVAQNRVPFARNNAEPCRSFVSPPGHRIPLRPRPTRPRC